MLDKKFYELSNLIQILFSAKSQRLLAERFKEMLTSGLAYKVFPAALFYKPLMFWKDCLEEQHRIHRTLTLNSDKVIIIG